MGSVKKETSILANNADGMNKQGSAVHVCTRKQSKTLKVQYEFPVVVGTLHSKSHPVLLYSLRCQEWIKSHI